MIYYLLFCTTFHIPLPCIINSMHSINILSNVFRNSLHSKFHKSNNRNIIRSGNAHRRILWQRKFTFFRMNSCECTLCVCKRVAEKIKHGWTKKNILAISRYRFNRKVNPTSDLPFTDWCLLRKKKWIQSVAHCLIPADGLEIILFQ